MGLIICVLCFFLLICVFDTSCSLNDLILNLPMEFGNVASDAWKGIMKAIKTPIRNRRQRRNRKIKIPTTKSTTELNREMFTESYIHRVTDPCRVKPTIPVLHQPVWRSLVDWRNLQKPSLVQIEKGLREGNVDINKNIQYEANIYERTRSR